MSSARQRVIDGVVVGDVFHTTRTFDAEMVAAFAELSGDHNPVHFDVRFAAAKGYNQPIVHGLLVGSLVTDVGGQLAWLATELSFRFRRPVYVGDTVTCRLEVTALDAEGRATAEATLTTDQGVQVASAQLRGRLPTSEERALLSG